MMPSAGRRELPEHEDGAEKTSRPRPEPLDWALLALSAVRRRKLVTFTVLLLGFGAVAAYYLSKPPTYRVEARILAQRHQAMPAASRAAFEEVPTRSAWEIIHRRENLIALARATSLASESAAPLPARGLVDSISSNLRRASEEPEDPLDTWVNILDRSLMVTVQDGTIQIAIELRDPQLAYGIVHGAVQNFLEARHLQEVKAIDEVLSVLRARAASLSKDVDAAVQESRRRIGSTPQAAAPRARQPSAELVRLQSLLAAKQRAIHDVEEFRRRRLSDLQAQLDQARSTLSDQHPTVIGLRKDIGALSSESPQVESLREEEQRLGQEYAERSAREGVSAAPPQAAAPVAGPVLERYEVEADPRVRQARALYEQIAQRVSTAEAELDAARAAFKYRYNVVWPPQVPREPVSPNPRRIFPLGLIASFVLAIAAAVAPDLLSGRVQQRWQVERVLGVEVLGEIDRRP
jgi:uncharacterized protein involved in exopolysaccharide biosynthesis